MHGAAAPRQPELRAQLPAVDRRVRSLRTPRSSTADDGVARRCKAGRWKSRGSAFTKGRATDALRKGLRGLPLQCSRTNGRAPDERCTRRKSHASESSDASVRVRPLLRPLVAVNAAIAGAAPVVGTNRSSVRTAAGKDDDAHEALRRSGNTPLWLSLRPRTRCRLSSRVHAIPLNHHARTPRVTIAPRAPHESLTTA